MLSGIDFPSEISRFRHIPANSGGFLADAPPTDAPKHRILPPFPPLSALLNKVFRDTPEKANP
jgi:hypothetical protein